MKFDSDLIEMARKVANQKYGKAKDDAHERVAEMAGEFEAACILSRGPDARRASHWLERAAAVKDRIYRYVDRGGDESQAVNRVKGH